MTTNSGAPGGVGRAILRRVAEMPVIVMLLVAWPAFIMLNSKFLSVNNILSLFVSNSYFGVAAIGLVFVFLTGGIDLSIGQVVACSSVVASLGMVRFQGWLVARAVGMGGQGLTLSELRTLREVDQSLLEAAVGSTALPTILVGLLIALSVGGMFGCINGIAVGHFGITPFIITLASQLTAKGISLVLTEGITVTGMPRVLTQLSINLGIPVGGVVVPWAAVIPVVFIVVFGIILAKTSWGRRVTLTGSNAQAARYAGINVRRTLFSVYLLSGLLAGFAGMLVPMCLGAADPKVGESMLLPIVGAITIGGVRGTGGYGTMLHAGLGIFMFATLMNGMTYLNLNLPSQQLVYGVILVISTAVMAGIGVSARRD